MNLKPIKSRDYGNFRLCDQVKNKAKTKPICEMTKMNVSSTKTDDYGKIPVFGRYKNKANSKPNKANPASSATMPGQVFRLAPGLALGVKKYKKNQPGVKRGNKIAARINIVDLCSIG